MAVLVRDGRIILRWRLTKYGMTNLSRRAQTNGVSQHVLYILHLTWVLSNHDMARPQIEDG
jgi:hypothetical protein